MSVVHGEIQIQNGTGRMPHPFQGVFIGQVLLSTVTGEEVPERVQFVLTGIFSVPSAIILTMQFKSKFAIIKDIVIF